MVRVRGAKGGTLVGQKEPENPNTATTATNTYLPKNTSYCSGHFSCPSQIMCVCVFVCMCNTLCNVYVCVHWPGAGYYYSSSKRRVWLLVRPLASVPVLCGAAGAGWSRRGGGVPALILPLLLMLLLLLLVLRLNSPSITPTTSSSPKDSSTI